MPRRHTSQKHQPFVYEAACQEKRRFTSERDAKEAAETLMLESPGLALHTYQCPRCKGWHLTRRTISI